MSSSLARRLIVQEAEDEESEESSAENATEQSERYYEIRAPSSFTENPQYVKSWRLSLTVAGWIVLFFIPVVCSNTVGSYVFMPTCLEKGSKLCFSEQMKTYWPNVVQLMFFTIYVDLGSTVRLAWQGTIGTLAVTTNVHIMAILFPSGGKCKRLGAERLFGVPLGLRQICEEYEDQNYEKYERFVWLDVLVVILLILGSNANDNTMKFALSWHVCLLMNFMSPDGYNTLSTIFAVELTTVLAVMLAIISMLPQSFRLSTSLKSAQKQFKKDFQQVLAATSNFIRLSPGLDHVQRASAANDLEYRIGQLLVSAEGFSTMHSSTWWEMALVGSYGNARRSLGVFKSCIGDSVSIALRLMLKAVLAESNQDYYLLEERKEWQHFRKRLLSERHALTNQADTMNKAVCEFLDCIIKSSKNTAPSEVELEDAFAKMKTHVKQIGTEKEKLEELAENMSMFVTGQLKEPLSGLQAVEAGASDALADAEDLNDLPRVFHNIHDNLLIYMYACLVISFEATKCPELWKESMTECMKHKTHAHTWADLPRAVLYTTRPITWDGFIETWGDLFKQANPWKSRFQLQLTKNQCWCPFWVKVMYDPAKRRFVLTNAIIIYLAFTLGNIFDGAVWTPYNANMAATLGVLISHHDSSPVHQNLMRLLGITLGKVIPIMLMAFVALFRGGKGGLETAVHLLVLFFYMAFFANVYYTSEKWSYVACLVAGFGCYAFVSDKWDDELFATRYQEIGQVTFAIFLQFFVDMMAMIICESWPRNKVVDNLVKIGCGDCKDEEETSLLIRAFHECWSGSIHDEEALSASAGQCKQVGKLIAKQRQLAEACEEGSVILAGPAGPFKLQLHSDCLALIEKLKVELDACYLLQWHVVKQSDSTISGGGHFSWNRSEIKHLQLHISYNFPITFARLLGILRLRGVAVLEEGITRNTMEKAEFEMKGTRSLPLCVARRVLRDIIDLLSQMNHACFSGGYIKTDFVKNSMLP